MALPRAGDRAAVLLPSGRPLTTTVRDVAADGTLTLETPPGPLQAEARVELRWAEGQRWCSLDCLVAEPAGGHLRLRAAGESQDHADRRGAPRREALALVELTVLAAADVMPGTRVREWVVDVAGAGLAFDTALGLAPGDALRLDVFPEGRGAVLAGPAHVVRSERPPGALASRVAVVLDDPPAQLPALLGAPPAVAAPERPLVLASRSPQRRAILSQLGLAFRVVEPAYEERALPLPPERLVQAYSQGKARSVEAGPDDGPVLGVDTEVVVDGRVYGKPPDAAAARAMLAELAGREHLVLSGLTLRGHGEEQTGLSTTVVRFRDLHDDEIDAYVAAGEWQGRAGGYAIQGRGAALVERIDGDYYNVVGLPVALLMTLLRLHAMRHADGAVD